MKELLLGLGTLVTIAAPLATVVACGSDHKTNNISNLDKTNNISNLDKYNMRYDDSLKLIIIDFSKIWIPWQKRQEYKDMIAEATIYLDDYNKDQSMANFNKINECENTVRVGIEEIISDCFSPLYARNYLSHIGMMIRTHPDAIGILNKNIGDAIIKNGDKYVFAKNQVQYSLDTFNIVEDLCNPGDNMRESFQFEIGQPFKMPEHKIWQTASESISNVTKEELEKPINRILEAIKKKPDNMTEKQEKEYPESLAKAKILFNDPSQDMKIYYYFSDISSPNVKTDKDFLDRVSDNIYQYLESDEYLKNKWLEEK